MQLSDFDYDLPPERIAQRPLTERDASRLLCLNRATGTLEDRMFRQLPDLLTPGDLLVANETRVFPARLLARISAAAGADAEALLLHRESEFEWSALVRPGRKLPVGAHLWFAPDLQAEIIAAAARGQRQLRFAPSGDLATILQRLGHVPLPPYITRPDTAGDRERYQTVFAQAGSSAAELRSAAAPTAGLHFTPAVLDRLHARGVEWATVNLEVGLGTFQPVSVENIEGHPMHAERYELGEAAAAAIARARRDRRRIVAVGTTSARVLETIAQANRFEPHTAESRLYLFPGRPFQLVGAMITNFHAPRTTLLMMIAAFAGLEPVCRAYQHALVHGYRFLSYGDCMLIG